MLNLKKQKLLVIAPHPDDEVLGCSGLIQKVKAGNGSVFVLFMTVGDTKDFSRQGQSTGAQRMEEIRNVSKFLGLDAYDIALPGNDYHLKLDRVPQLELISLVEKFIQKVKPTIVAMPQTHDYNQDHVACARATLAATRPAPLADKHSPQAILGYRSVLTAGWAEPTIPNHNLYIELSKQDLTVKAKALSLYTSQVRENGHQRTPEAIEKIARTLGIYAGTEYAESFYAYKLLATVRPNKT